MPVFDDAGKEITYSTRPRAATTAILAAWAGISGNHNATYLEQEGALIKSFKLASGG